MKQSKFIFLIVLIFQQILSQKWDYNSQGKDWQDPKCKQNAEGSPIDLVGSFGDGSTLQLEFSPNTADIKSMFEFDGNKLFQRGNFGSFNLINTTSGKAIVRSYEIQKIDVKHPCEHLLQSDGCDVEVQLFAPETEESITVSGESKRPNMAFVFRFKSIQKQSENFFTELKLEKVNQISTMNLFKAMKTSSALTGKANVKWAYYPGSLTVPFCDDNVHWFVVQPVLEIQPGQLANLEKLITKNATALGGKDGIARQVQILGKRNILEGDLNLDGFKQQTKALLKAYQCSFQSNYTNDFTLWGYTHDEEYLISTSGPQTRVWRVKEKKPFGIIKGHKDCVTAFSYRSLQKFVTGAKDNKLITWDISSNAQIKTYEGLTNYPLSLFWSFDETKIVSGDMDHNVIIWDVASGSKQVYKGHESEVTQVAFSEDNKKVYSTDAKGYVKIWNVEKKGEDPTALIKSYRGHKSRINALLIIKHYVITGGNDTKINVFNEKNDCDDCKFEGHKGPVNSLVFKAELQFASSSFDNTIKVWDLKKKQIIKSGYIVKDTPYILIQKQSIGCKFDKEQTVSPVDGVSKNTKTGLRFKEKRNNIDHKYMIAQ